MFGDTTGYIHVMAVARSVKVYFVLFLTRIPVPSLSIIQPTILPKVSFVPKVGVSCWN